MQELETALARIQDLDAQVRAEVIRGVTVRRKENGIPVLSIHYSADPDRDPATERGALWYAAAKGEYASEASWKREQEIDALAGGGERVFAVPLGSFHDKIIITDPKWHPDPRWDVVAGFDYGGTNATCLLLAYLDFVGNIYFCGEYYSMKRPGFENLVADNAPQMLKMPNLDRLRWCMADPSIFPDTQVQSDGSRSSINKSFVKNGVKFLREFQGDRSDISLVETVLSIYWRKLAENAPRMFIVCRNESDRLQPGLHPYDCPNLVWELNRSRRAELTARQMLTKNPTEKIVDRLNHARDSWKYVLHTVTRPTEIPLEDQMRAAVSGLNPTSAAIAAQRFYADKVKKKGKTFSYRGKARMR